MGEGFLAGLRELSEEPLSELNRAPGSVLFQDRQQVASVDAELHA